MQIQILLFNGFDELDALAPFEVLHSAAKAGADLQPELVWLEETSIVSARGLRLHVERQFDPAHPPALLLLPGGGWNARAAEGVWTEVQRGKIPALVAAMHQAGITLAAICTGAMFLAAAGLLQGRPAVTYRGALEDLRASGAEIVRARVVDDGEILTSGGVTSGLDLALWLVERYAGSAIAHAVEQSLEYERRGVVWRRSAQPGLQATEGRA